MEWEALFPQKRKAVRIVKSVTIKDNAGRKLVKVIQKKGEYLVETRNDIRDLDILIVTDDNQRVKIPVRKKWQ